MPAVLHRLVYQRYLFWTACGLVLVPYYFNNPYSLTFRLYRRFHKVNFTFYFSLSKINYQTKNHQNSHQPKSPTNPNSQKETNTTPIPTLQENTPKMADGIDIYNQYPLVLDPTSKAINLSSQNTTPASANTVTNELTELNALHRGLISLDPPSIPPPPLPINPKRSAQITKLRDSANTAYRKDNYAEAVRLYTFAIEMGIARPGWEPMSLAREELAGLFANRAQAYMAQQAWAEGLVDAKCSVESKPVGNVKAWWRAGKCLAEMGRWDEAQVAIDKGLEFEPRSGDGAKELLALMEEVKEGLKRSSTSA